MSFDDIDRLAHLVYRMGIVDPEKIDDIGDRLQKRALVVKLNIPGQFLVLGPKKNRWAIDSELKKLGAQEKKFPEGMKGIPSDMLSTVHADLAAVEDSIRALQDKKLRQGEARSEEITFLLTNLAIDVSIDAVKQGFASTGSVQKVTGWVPRSRFREVAAGTASLTAGRIALQTYEPDEIPEVRTGRTRVPVSTPHGGIVRAFERMVFSYSIPPYGTIDPTPFVAVMFVLLFGIMFGDVGQGFVGLGLGVLINTGWVKSFEGYRRKSFGTIFILAGVAAMLAGFLYGSVFADESLLVPVTRLLSRLLLGHPLDHFISLGELPEDHSLLRDHGRDRRGDQFDRSSHQHRQQRGASELGEGIPVEDRPGRGALLLVRAVRGRADPPGRTPLAVSTRSASVFRFSRFSFVNHLSISQRAIGRS